MFATEKNDRLPRGRGFGGVWSWLRVVGAALLIVLAVRQVAGAGRVSLPWRELDGGWLAGCFGLTALSVAGWWLRWWLFLRLAGVRASARETLGVTWIADFFNYFVLGPVAADGFRLMAMRRRHPGSTGAIAASIVFDHIAGLVAVSLFFGVFTWPAAGWIAERGGPLVGGVIRPAGWTVVLVSLLALSAIGATPMHLRWVSIRLRWWPTAAGRVLHFAKQMGTLRRRAGWALLGLMASAGCLAGTYAAFVAAAAAWQAPVVWRELFAVLPLVDVLGALPVSVQGLGIREQILLPVLTTDGGPDPARVLALSLTGFAVQSVWALLGGGILAWQTLRTTFRPRAMEVSP